MTTYAEIDARYEQEKLQAEREAALVRYDARDIIRAHRPGRHGMSLASINGEAARIASLTTVSETS